MRTAVKLLKLFCAFATFLVPTSSFAQYIRTDLVSNTGTVPNPADLDLVKRLGSRLDSNQPVLGERQRYRKINSLRRFEPTARADRHQAGADSYDPSSDRGRTMNPNGNSC